MSSDPSIIAGISTSAAPSAPDPAKAQGEQVRRLAQEFEALLMTQMLKDMRKSLLSDEDEGDSKSGPLMDTADAELGRALTSAGGFGLTDVLMNAMRRQLQGTTSPDASDPKAFAAAIASSVGLSSVIPTNSPRPADITVPASTAPLATATPAPDAGVQALVASTLDAPAQPDGRVTSGFGWRSDPLTGALRFHSGVDIAMAYGQDVQAAASGRVVFAGPSGDYGNMVVLDHGEGHQTRYAHLAQPLVREGDEVDVGQIIGKSGNTGRTTGPHLHFEVLSNGQAVAPSVAGGRQ